MEAKTAAQNADTEIKLAKMREEFRNQIEKD